MYKEKIENHRASRETFPRFKSFVDSSEQERPRPKQIKIKKEYF
jgi:hypothetical protein